jgi:hypothetical protein
MPRSTSTLWAMDLAKCLSSMIGFECCTHFPNLNNYEFFSFGKYQRRAAFFPHITKSYDIMDGFGEYESGPG